MSKKALAVAFILALSFSAVAISQSVNLTLANYIPYPPTPNKDPPTLIVQTPQDGDTYTVNTVEVNFTVTKPASWLYEGRTLYYWVGFPIIGTYSVWIYLDGNLSAQYSDLGAENGIDNLTANYSVVLNGLMRGGHSVKIDVMATTFYNIYYPNHPPGGAASNYDMDNVSKTMHFIINSDPPRISILSPANKDYTTTDIPLNFKVNRPVSQITYSLDGHNNTAIAGNITLTGLYYGHHHLTVHAIDTAGNTGDSETITFRVTKPEPFPTTWVIVAAIAIAAAGGVSFTFYHLAKAKKRNKKAE